MNDNTGAEAAVPELPVGGVVGRLGSDQGSSSPPSLATRDRPGAELVARELERWGRERDWVGPDPYEGLRSPLLRRLAPGRLRRRLAIQLVRRSPLDLRRPLRIAPRHEAAAIGQLLSAYSRLPWLTPAEREERVEWALERLRLLRTPGREWPSWGYGFDVETRFFFYGAGTPNVIATGFAANGLLDAHQATGSAPALELARGAGEFLAREITFTAAPDPADGGWLGYFPGDATPIHNASLIAASVLARLDAIAPTPRYREPAAAATEFALRRQRPDGSWPYAEVEDGDWVDGHHTAYVLDALGRLAAALGHGRAAAARRRGLRFYAARLFEPSGTARFYADSRYPIDTISIAAAISCFAAAAGGSDRGSAEETEPGWLDAAWTVFGDGVARMRRRDGAFAYQRRRLWANRTPHIRWAQAPMLDALARLLEAEARVTGAGGPGGGPR